MPTGNAGAVFKAVAETQGVEGVFEISNDGFLLRALQSRSNDPEAIAAAIAATMRSWKKIGKDLKLGMPQTVVLEYKRGRVVVAQYENTMLVIIGSTRMIYGDVLLKVRSSAGS